MGRFLESPSGREYCNSIASGVEDPEPLRPSRTTASKAYGLSAVKDLLRVLRSLHADLADLVDEAGHEKAGDCLVGWFEYSSPLYAACRHLRRLLMPGQAPVETIAHALNQEKKRRSSTAC